MQEHVQLTDKQITDDLVSPVLRSAKWFWMTIGFLSFIMVLGLSGYVWELYSGLGVTNVRRPVFGVHILLILFFG